MLGDFKACFFFWYLMPVFLFVQNLLLFPMDEVTWSYVVLVLAIVPWLVYAFILTFFGLSILYG